jgi:hypothetical protein
MEAWHRERFGGGDPIAVSLIAMHRHERPIRSAWRRRPKDKLVVPVIAMFIGLVAAALLFAWLERPDEMRQAPGTVASTGPLTPNARAVVTLVKLDEGLVVRCSRLANFGVGTRVTISISKTWLLRREIADC